MPPKRKFRDAWLNDIEFQPWLQQVPGNPERARCSYCSKKFNSELSAIKRHKASQFHIQHDLEEDLEDLEDVPLHDTCSGVALATILFACFIAEHNFPFTTANHLVDVMKRMFPDSRIAQNMAMKRTKCTDVVKRLGNYVSSDTIRKLKTNKFSVIMDETTSTGSMKSCAILVRYFDTDSGKITTRLLDMVDMYNQDDNGNGSTGENLFKVLMGIIERNDIPRENFIGFAADGASNFMGEHNSLCSRLTNNFQGLTVFRCICHSIHICCSEAAKALPRRCEDLLRNIYSYFSHSVKRKKDLKLFQAFCEVKPHKILHACQTRWLSLHQAVERILEQWHPLKLYFIDRAVEDHLIANNIILEYMNNESTLLFLHFLNFILPKFTKFNLLFQKDAPTIHVLYDSIHELYRNLLGYFCKAEVCLVQDIMTINPNRSSNFKPLNQIYLGAALHGLLQKPEIAEKKVMIADVRLRCRLFMIRMCNQFTKRFSLNSKLWKLCSFLSPKKVLDCRSRVIMPSMYELVAEVPRIFTGDIQVIDDEWRNIDATTIPDDIKGCTHNVLEFYNGLMQLEDHEGSKKFYYFCQFAMQVLSLPTTNVEAERLFSKLSLMKTKTRNALQLPSINALISLSQCVNEQGGCIKFKPTQDMLNLFID